MVLSAYAIRFLVTEGCEVYDDEGEKHFKPLIEPVDDERLKFIEGSAYDLTLDEMFELCSGCSIGTDRRTTPGTMVVRPDKSGYYCIPADGKARLMVSTEIVNLPIDVMADVFPRSTMYRCGLIVSCGQVHPNYQGKITVAVVNCGPRDAYIQRWARFVSLRFHQFQNRETDAYRGIWGTGKNEVSTNGKSERPY